MSDDVRPRNGEIVELAEAPGYWIVVETKLGPDDEPSTTTLVVPLPWEHRQVVANEKIRRQL